MSRTANFAVLAAVFCVAFAGPMVRPASAQAKCVALSPSVIAREGPGRSFAQSGSLPAHAQITITEQKNGWYHFTSDAGLDGWQGSSAFEDCQEPVDPEETPSTPPSTAAPDPIAADSLPAAATVAPEQITVTQLPVNDSVDTISGYNRDDFGSWQDADQDCQNTRHEVLIDESASPAIFEGNNQCHIDAGEWHDPYTDTLITSASQLDVDHVVPLANAFRSGAWQWSEEKKQAYMNFMADQNHLIAVESSTNRSKSDRGPEEWRPPNENYWCEYAQAWANIKSTWELTVTSAEQSALNDMLGTCPVPVVETDALQTGDDPNPDKRMETAAAPTTTFPSERTQAAQEPRAGDKGERTGAICGDGWTSDSTGAGTCSAHDGAAEWLLATPEEHQSEIAEPEQQQQAQTDGERTGATCNDGWTSDSTGGGTCSGHDGVAEWLYRAQEEESDQESNGEAENASDAPEQEQEPDTTPEPQLTEPEPDSGAAIEPTPEFAGEVADPEPEEETDEPVRVGAVCGDGTQSSATGRGACSRHDGVDHWIMRED